MSPGESLEEDFVATLSGTFGGRLYASVAPASAGTNAPYATYLQVSGVPETPMDGSAPSLVNARFQLDIFGRDKLAINTLAKAAESAMNSASRFKSVCVNQMDNFEEPQILYRVMRDFSIWWKG